MGAADAGDGPKMVRQGSKTVRCLSNRKVAANAQTTPARPGGPLNGIPGAAHP